VLSALATDIMSGVNDAPQQSRPARPRIVLAHDWLVGMRGGEWVLDRLARLFGPTDLYTLVNDGRRLTDAIAACRVITSPLQWLPRASGKWRRAYLPLMPWAVERLHVSPRIGDGVRPHPGPLPVGEGVDLLISTSSAVMKSIRPPAGVPHLCYCHTPARYVWEQTEEYGQGSGGWWRGAGLRAIRKRFQEWDRRSANDGRVTKFLANSEHTARRIDRCFGREATVVYPPVRTEFFTPAENAASRGREDWLLVVAALEPYKRTDIAIAAAVHAGWKLKVVGTGSQMKSLRVKAGRRVELLGRVDDLALRELYRRARALIFPQTEDFGIIAAEAQACGCPVIAYLAGGAMEIVTEDTGVFMQRQSKESLIEAVRSLDRRQFDPQACRDNALRFSESRFDQAILAEVDSVLRAK
jgi:glycosyltransferase involved in cell wall biosynthesis